MPANSAAVIPFKCETLLILLLFASRVAFNVGAVSFIILLSTVNVRVPLFTDTVAPLVPLTVRKFSTLVTILFVPSVIRQLACVLATYKLLLSLLTLSVIVPGDSGSIANVLN